ncbi:hypothetical protein [Flavobacterium sp. 3HN19-14]|uniref:hypothetical protein n=1 Tax=Flavobacterium sp. 3HN19-14 TaxID=3448133 RepID=UPI003EE03631
MFLFFFVMIAAASWSQENQRKLLKGKIIAGVSNASDINIVNIQTEKYTVSDEEGYFSIAVQAGDTLMFSAVQFNALKVGIKEEDFQKEILFVKMEPVVNQLSEVVVKQYKNINAVSLGIIPNKIKSYTPAERRLKAGTKGAMALDPLLNAISGRTAQLKRDLATEKREFWLEKIREWYEDALFTDELKIPADFVKAFQYYIIEDKHFTDVLDTNKKELTRFMMGELATKYKLLSSL